MRGELGDTGIVHQDVDAAPFRHGGAGDLAAVLVASDIALHDERLTAGFPDEVSGPFASLSLFEKFTTILAPLRANPTATAAPIPVAEPVTMAVLPLNPLCSMRPFRFCLADVAQSDAP